MCLLAIQRWSFLQCRVQLGYMGGTKETQGTHCCVVPQVPRPLGSLSSFHLSESSFAYLLCYVQGLLVVGGKTWEEWDYSILERSGSPKISFKCFFWLLCKSLTYIEAKIV